MPPVRSIDRPDPHERVLVREPDLVLVEGQDMGRYAVECDVARHGQAVDLSVCCSIDRHQLVVRERPDEPVRGDSDVVGAGPGIQLGRDAVSNGVDAPDEPLVRLRDPDRVRPGRQVAGVAAQCDLSGDIAGLRNRPAGLQACRSG